MNEEICKVCGSPKTTQKSGRLTQFLLVCKCHMEVAALDQEISVQICDICKKRIDDGRDGTLTQYIFRSEPCQCEYPKPIKRKVNEEASQKVIEGITEEGIDIEGIEVDPTAFPVDRYKALGKLGQGASGLVYLALDKILGTKVAIKTLNCLNPEQLIQFQEEARSTSKLDHANIIDILDFGATNSGTPYMVLEYFEGTTLEELIRNREISNWETIKKIFVNVCEALEYANKHGIYHRDLKPSNILVRGNGTSELAVRIIDFGVAKHIELTGTAVEYQGLTLAGTPIYMSPDVLNGYSYSAASEVYSLGCILFEVLVGHPPFQAETAIRILAMHAREDLEDIQIDKYNDLPIQVEFIVKKCLEKNPDNRYKTAGELKNELENAVFEESVTETKLETEKKLSTLESRIVFAGIFVIVSGIVLSFFIFQDEKNSQKRTTKKTKSTVQFKLVSESVDTKGYFEAATKERKKRNYYEAEKLYSQVLNLNPNHSQSLYDRALVRYMQKKYRSSLDDTKKLIAANPDHYLAYGLKGMNLRKMGKIDKAISAYNKAIKINPDYYRGYFMKGNISIAARDYHEAIRQYKKVKMLPDDNLYGLYMLNKAAAYYGIKEYSKSLEVLDTAIKNGSRLKSLFLDKAQVLSKLGKIDESIKIIDDAIKLFPRSPRLLKRRKHLIERAKHSLKSNS